MQTLLWFVGGGGVGAVVMAFCAMKSREDLINEYEKLLKLRRENSAKAIAKLQMEHLNELRLLETEHAKEKVAEFKRGKESDGVVCGAKGRMESVKPKAAPVKARRFGDKVTGVK